jgi:hypothetical protein
VWDKPTLFPLPAERRLPRHVERSPRRQHFDLGALEDLAHKIPRNPETLCDLLQREAFLHVKSRDLDFKI